MQPDNEIAYSFSPEDEDMIVEVELSIERLEIE